MKRREFIAASVSTAAIASLRPLRDLAPLSKQPENRQPSSVPPAPSPRDTAPVLPRAAAPQIPETPRSAFDKPVLIFAQGVHHVTLVGSILGHYLDRKLGRENLGDYFGHSIGRFSEETSPGNYRTLPYDKVDQVPGTAFRFDYRDDGAGISLIKDFEADWTNKVTVEATKLQRLALLQKYHERRYLLKLRAFSLNEPVFDHLNSNYRFICIESSNLLEAALLDQAMRKTGRFSSRYQEAPLSLPAPLSLSKSELQLSLQHLWKYRHYANRIADKVIIKDTQIESLSNPFEVLDLMGYHDWPNYLDDSLANLIVGDVRLPKGHLSSFAEPRKIQRWFRELSRS